MNDSKQTIQPTFVRYLSTSRGGVQSQNMSRHSIGFVISGKLHIHTGDSYTEVSKSELYYLGIGTHYTENIPEEGKFEMIVFYITPENLSQTINNLNITYGVSLEPISCENCHSGKTRVFKATKSLETTFAALSQMLTDEEFNNDTIAQNIKSDEIIYQMLSSNDCCQRNLILSMASTKKDRLEQVVHKHIFEMISIDDLASKCNRSLSTFKKEFIEIFNDTPHRWIMRQRLIHARLMLISTDRDLADICRECKFHNSSHFIKLFRREYGTTPAVYRQRHSTEKQKSKTTRIEA